MAKKKIFNDPVYGFISFPYDLLYDLIDHRYFQRLRRITQLGLTHYVYPGALHTRFHHALGATYLMTEAIQVLKEKGIEITDNEALGVSIAILLHDVGHGPYSHALEHSIIDLHHEELSLRFMEILNEEFDGQLDTAIQIFKGEYPKSFLHDLVSSQLDMDRMDYLIRDSYFTGVAEGVIGYNRIIKMLNVVDGRLVVEEKGIFSVEKFLVARRLMYWQVYLHKTVLSAEQMLIATLKRAKMLIGRSVKVYTSPRLGKLLELTFHKGSQRLENKEYIDLFSLVDDIDILDLFKNNTEHPDFILSYLCRCMLERKLFRIYLQSQKISEEKTHEAVVNTEKSLGISRDLAESLILEGVESNQTYNSKKEEIRILQKTGEVKPLSEFETEFLNSKLVKRHFMCFPKSINS